MLPSLYDYILINAFPKHNLEYLNSPPPRTYTNLFESGISGAAVRGRVGRCMYH